MDFKVPPGYDDFVTSAEDLLKEFKSGESCDYVSYRIYFDHLQRKLVSPSPGVYVSDLQQILDDLDAINNFVEKEFGYYIWQREAFSLSIIARSESTPTVAATSSHSSASSSANYNKPGGQFYLQGYTRVGQNIDDEWFISYILLRISKLFPHTFSSIVDSDGQFLLIEASDFIPDWMGPENSDNRVWIHDGQIGIIDIEDLPGDSSNCITLMSALQFVMDSQSGFRHNGSRISNGSSSSISSSSGGIVLDSRVQNALAGRTTRCYPARAKALEHNAVCILPRWAAALLAEHPQLVSIAVNSYFAFDPRDRIGCKEYFPADFSKVYKNIDAEERGRLSKIADNSFNSDARNAVVFKVRFSRPLYAQLTFKKFHPPRKYHSLMRLVSQAGSRAANKAFDIGCRLTVGLEAAYHQSLYHWYRIEQPIKSKDISGAVPISTANELRKLAEASGYISSSSLNGAKDNKESENVKKMSHICQLYKKKILRLALDAAASDEESGCEIGGDDKDFYEYIRLPVGKYLHELFHESTTKQNEIIESSSSLDNVSMLNTDGEYVVDCSAIISKTLVADDENWLYMSPEEMDKEMTSRINSFNNDASTSSKSSGGSSRSSCNSSSSYCASSTKESPLMATISNTGPLLGVGSSVITMDAMGGLKDDASAASTCAVSDHNTIKNTQLTEYIDSDDEIEPPSDSVASVADSDVAANLPGIAVSSTGTSTSNKETTAQLQNIVDGIKTFLNGKSDYDGFAAPGLTASNNSNSSNNNNNNKNEAATTARRATNSARPTDGRSVSVSRETPKPRADTAAASIKRTKNGQVRSHKGATGLVVDDAYLKQLLSSVATEELTKKEQPNTDIVLQEQSEQQIPKRPRQQQQQQQQQEDGKKDITLSKENDDLRLYFGVEDLEQLSSESECDSDDESQYTNNSQEEGDVESNVRSYNSRFRSEYQRKGSNGGREGGDKYDSESERDEDNDGTEEDELITEYMRQMDAQIYGESGSTMASTFVSYTGAAAEMRKKKNSKEPSSSHSESQQFNNSHEEVDIDMNLLQNLLESHAMSFNMPTESPAAALLAQYGISMPPPPPQRQQQQQQYMKTKSNAK